MANMAPLGSDYPQTANDNRCVIMIELRWEWRTPEDCFGSRIDVSSAASLLGQFFGYRQGDKEYEALVTGSVT